MTIDTFSWSRFGKIIYELNLYYFRDIFDWPIPKKSHFLVFPILILVKAKKANFVLILIKCAQHGKGADI